MNPKVSSSDKIITNIKKDKSLVDFQDLFFITIAQIDEISTQSKNSSILIDLNLILDVQLPKIIDSYLNLTEEQKNSDKQIRNNKTNKELFTEQILLINEKIHSLHEIFLEEKQHDFLVIHRKTKTISGGSSSNIETEKEFSYKSSTESLQEKGKLLFQASNYLVNNNNENLENITPQLDYQKHIDIDKKIGKKNLIIFLFWILTLVLFVFGLYIAF